MSAHRIILAVGFLAATAACGAAEGEPIDLGETSQAITGGLPVTGSMLQQNYTQATLSMKNRENQDSCTGTRISARKILTAGHCLSSYQPGDRLLLRNGESSAQGSNAFATVAQIYQHPAYVAMKGKGFGMSQFQGYDVGIVEITDSADFNFVSSGGGRIPALATNPDIDGDRVSDGQWGRLVAYGCNNGVSDGVKRWGDFEAKPRSLMPSQRQWLLDEEGDRSDHLSIDWSRIYAQNIISQSSLAQACEGDSGGPFFQSSAAGWQIIGIVWNGYPNFTAQWDVEGSLPDKLTFFARTANLKRWISYPNRTNQFTSGRVGYLLNTDNAMCAGPDFGGNSAPINQYFCDTGYQHEAHFLEWKAQYEGNGYYSFRNENTGKCMTWLPSDRVGQNSCTGSRLQEWKPISNNANSNAWNNQYRLQNRDSGKCLARGSGQSVGSYLRLRNCDDDRAWYVFHP